MRVEINGATRSGTPDSVVHDSHPAADCNEILKKASTYYAHNAVARNPGLACERAKRDIDHSDRGSQYLALRYTERLAQAGKLMTSVLNSPTTLSARALS